MIIENFMKIICNKYANFVIFLNTKHKYKIFENIQMIFENNLNLLKIKH